MRQVLDVVPRWTVHDAPSNDRPRKHGLRQRAAYAGLAVLVALILFGAGLLVISQAAEVEFERTCLSTPNGIDHHAVFERLDPNGERIRITGYAGPASTRITYVAVPRRYRGYRLQQCNVMLGPSGTVTGVRHGKQTDFDDWMTDGCPRRRLVAKLVLPLLP